MPPLPWSRPEPFGAWVRLDDSTLVAVDHDLAARLGVVGDPNAEAPTRPLELHVAVTARCPAGCTGCYVDARPEGLEPSFEVVRSRLREARALGVSTVAFGGGEPLLRRDLGRLAEEARALGLVPVMTTSGLGLTEDRASELRAFAQINVSHDGVREGYERVRGWEGGGVAERAVALLSASGIAVGVNVVLTRASFDLLGETADRVADLGARELQLLRYKPAGRAAGLEYLDRRLTAVQVDRLWPLLEALVQVGRVALRIDCAMVPLLSRGLMSRVPDPTATLVAMGVFGCEAAHHLGALRVNGVVLPCSFDQRSSDAAATLVRGWDEAAGLEAFRGYHAAPHEPCASCALYAVCRGGCQVVSRHASGAFAPDPECPRVVEHRRSAPAGG